MAARAAGGPAALAVTAGRPSGYEPVHCWFGLPLQVHSSARAPSAVLASVTSRHRPDCTPVIVPLAFRDHCWLVPPLQGRMSTAVPGAVPCPEASRQSPPQYTVSWPEEVAVHCWFGLPLQSQISTWVPSVCVAFGTSRHLPASTAWISLVALLPPVLAARAASSSDHCVLVMVGWF